jgi:hypothetical protein
VGSQFTPTGGLAAYSNMGGIIELATGDYCMELLEIEWSDEDWKSAQEAVVPKDQLRRYRRLEMLTAFCFLIGSITLLFSVPLLLKTVYDYFFQSSLNNCSTTQLQPIVVVVLAGGSLFGLGLLAVRCRSRSALTQLLKTVTQEMPNYVLIAKRHIGLQS